ncbi:MAG: hypothetical protein H0V88_04485 [Pyrinomonadaceae bacterium]|nr:hypothetical protein [Pyrinomonadaceae bacterium]
MNGWTKMTLNFKIICAWCGVVIRRDNTEDSSGMCFTCYYRILSKHFQAQRQADIPFHASER